MKNFYIISILLLCLVGLTFSQQTAGKTQIGFYGSTIKFVGGQQDDSMISPWFGFNIGYAFSPKIGLNFEWAMGWDRAFDNSLNSIGKYFKVRPGTPYRNYLYPLIINLKYNFIPEKTINPYFVGGLGVLFWDLRDVSQNDSIIPLTAKGVQLQGIEANFLFNIGLGSEFFVTEKFAFDYSIRYQQLIAQNKDMSGFGDKQTGNIEARVGLNFYFGGWKDTDNDGIEDKLDNCPKQPEDVDGFQDLDGCPDLDNDLDGIPDQLDKAPEEAEDKDGFEDSDGIPDLDNDGDGVQDSVDKCPNEPEDKDGFEDNDGCPDPDNDKDGIPDEKDKCPDEPETVNEFEDEDGCPDKKPEVFISTKTPIVLEGVTFNSGSAELTVNAKKVLDAVYRTLNDYPEMVVQVRGHTDNTGNRSYNLQLSKRRAESVKIYLISKGINSMRIETVGYGPDDPIESNTTSAGRAKNRRIEFIRLK
ncbi:OmpA family protein [candidate division KSB1 bacterium]|nr:OmpA family protein [candidate division KSB1 bacterium]